MKKLLAFSFFAIFLLAVPPVRAQTCPEPNYVYDYNAGCIPDPNTASGGAYTAQVLGQTVADTSTPGATSSQSSGTPAPGGSGKFVPIAPIPNLTQGATADQGGLARFLNNLYIFLVGLAAAIAVVEIIWGGLEIATKDSVPMHMKGKERIQQALLGLLLVLSPVLVFSIINPQILNLSANIPPLDIHKGNAAVTPTGTNPNKSPATGNPFKPTTSSNEMTTTLYSCTSNTCNDVVKQCMANNNIRNAGDAQIVCLTSGGNVDPNGRTDHWYTSGYSCVAGETLAVQCIQFTGVPQN